MFEEKRENISKHTPKDKEALGTIRLQIILAMLNDDPRLMKPLRSEALRNWAERRRLIKQLAKAGYSEDAIQEILRIYGADT